jgi:hypothetical protein
VLPVTWTGTAAREGMGAVAINIPQSVAVTENRISSGPFASVTMADSEPSAQSRPSVSFPPIADIRAWRKLRDMNGILRATAQTVPKAMLYRVAGGVALGSAALALAFVAIIHPYLGTVVGYVVVPLLAALLVWAIAGVVRLRLVGFLPSDADHYIPTTLQPWIRFWLVVRFGLLGAMLLLLVAIVGAAVAGAPITYSVEAFVYVGIVRMFMDLIFGAAFNLCIISRRHITR